MPKPILLLVDDEPSVIEALEAALAPAFSEVLRIEAFTNPTAVLAEAKRWEAENRLVAVTVADQKMPGMDGVEFLAGLRQSSSATAGRSVLLTAYAGLESALAAKNDVRVDRYMEKPWCAEGLRAAVRDLLAHYLEEAAHDHFFVFREVNAREELEQLLAMRFQVYRHTTVGSHLLPTDGCDLDVDAYDLVSRFFGLFEQSLIGRRLAGTLRVAGQELGPAAAVLEGIAAARPKLSTRLHARRRYPLPLMEYLLDREAVAALAGHAASRGERVVEPGRLTLDPVLRGGRHLARHIVESAVAFFFFFLEIDNAILTCSPPQDRFYYPFGFERLASTARRFYPEFGANVDCLHGTRERVPNERRGPIFAMAERIRRTGATCRCSSFPACLGSAYETGDFAGVDVFCPWRAREILRG